MGAGIGTCCCKAEKCLRKQSQIEKGRIKYRQGLGIEQYRQVKASVKGKVKVKIKVN
jgi:hypothetical protein